MKCDVSRCKRPMLLSYAAFKGSSKDVNVCDHHWKKHCDERDRFDLRNHFFPKKEKQDAVTGDR